VNIFNAVCRLVLCLGLVSHDFIQAGNHWIKPLS